MNRLASPGRRILAGGIVMGALVVGAGLAALDPLANEGLPRCVLNARTGLECPTCGTLRATHALLNGRVADALAANALAVGLLPLVLYWLVNEARVGLGRPARRYWPRHGAIWAGFLALGTACFTLARNLF